jgi:hypothetical protein
MTSLKTTYKRRPMLYGSATAYNWVHDPFSDPVDLMRKRKARLEQVKKNDKERQRRKKAKK